MKPLKTKHLGLFSKIVKKLQLKDEIVNMFRAIDIEKPEGLSEGEFEKLMEHEVNLQNTKMMAELTILFVENYYKAEKEIHEFFGLLTDKEPNDIAELPLNELIELFKELMGDESIASFFNLVV